MKYVIIENDGNEYAICFPEFVNHDTFREMQPISAAKFSLFVSLVEGAAGTVEEIEVNVYGESLGLKLSPRPNDARLIKQAIMFKC